MKIVPKSKNLDLEDKTNMKTTVCFTTKWTLPVIDETKLKLAKQT